MTLRIIQMIDADKRLSVYGRNVEVATLNGKSTLRGRTMCQSNKDLIFGYASSVTGKGNVIDLLVVRPITETEKMIDR